MWSDDGSLAEVLSPFVVAATFMTWTDECVIDSTVNHDGLFREKPLLRALKKKNDKLDYKTSDIAAALDTIRKQKKAEGNDLGLHEDVCNMGPRSWQYISARRIACMLRHITKAQRAAKPPVWVKLLFQEEMDTQVDGAETLQTQPVIEVGDSPQETLQTQPPETVEDLAPFPALRAPKSF